MSGSEFEREIDLWMRILAKYDWPHDAKPYIDPGAVMVPEIYDRNGRQVVEWARVTSREQLLRVLGMGPIFD